MAAVGSDTDSPSPYSDPTRAGSIVVIQQGWARVDEWFEPDGLDATGGRRQNTPLTGGGVLVGNRKPTVAEFFIIAALGALAMGTIRAMPLARFYAFAPGAQLAQIFF